MLGPRTCPMNALVAVVSQVYALSTAALSRRLRLVTVCSKRLIVSATWVTCAGGGCMAAATARCRCAWGKFRENLPLLTSKPVTFDLKGLLFSSNVSSSMLHGTETWPMTSDALHRLCRNDRAMIRCICWVKPSDDPSMDDLHAKLGICDLAVLVRERRLRWFGHVMRSNGEINRVRSRPVPRRKGPGRPKKTCDECVKQDLKVCGLSEAGTQDRVSWRSSVKNSRQEPTPSNGSAPQSMAAPPARRVLGMRTRSFNKTGFDWWYTATPSVCFYICTWSENDEIKLFNESILGIV